MDKFLSKMGVVESDGKGSTVMVVEDVGEWKLYKTFFAGHCAAVHISYIIYAKNSEYHRQLYKVSSHPP